MFGSVGWGDAQSDVGADFLGQPFPDMARRDQFAVQSGQRTVVDRELHLNGRRINRHKGQRLARDVVRDGFADEHILEPGHADHVARMGLGDFNALQSFEMKNGGDFALGLAAVAVQAGGGVAHLDLAAVNLAEGDASEVIGIIEVGDEHLEFRRRRGRAAAGCV